MLGSYWSEIANRRIRRRTALGTAGGMAAGAMLLAACGSGGGKQSSSAGGVSGILTQPVDTTQQAKRGGVMKDRGSSDPPTLDTFAASGPLNPIASHGYNELMQFKPGYMKPRTNEFDPGIAESWETSPD